MASSSHNREVTAVAGGASAHPTPANSTTIFDQARRASGSSDKGETHEGGGLLDKAKDKINQMTEAVKDQMHTGNSPTHMKGNTGGGVTQKAQTGMDETMQSIGKNIGGNTHGNVGGSQLFGSPADSKEGQAGNQFLSKYTNETAPGENTS